jgi:hypothetical protein
MPLITRNSWTILARFLAGVRPFRIVELVVDRQFEANIGQIVEDLDIETIGPNPGVAALDEAALPRRSRFDEVRVRDRLTQEHGERSRNEFTAVVRA